MTRSRVLISFLFCTALVISCEDVVDVDVPTESPRLIVDALIRIDTSSPDLIPLSVKVTESSSFFESIPVTGLSQLSISNNTTNDFVILNEGVPGSGIYDTVDGGGRALASLGFFLGGEMILQVQHEGQRYLARTFFVPSSTITSLEFQADEDRDIINVGFQDNPDSTNFYVFDMDFGEFVTVSDELFDGEAQQFSYEYDQDVNEVDSITVSLLGADQEFFNYMNVLINQGLDDASPFDTPVAAARGNIINVTEIDNIDFFDNVDQTNNFALGYFGVVSTNSVKIRVP